MLMTECEVNEKIQVTTRSPTSSPVEDGGQNGSGGVEENTVDVIAGIRQDYEAEITRIRKEGEMKLKEAKKEKESMVMRYANSEKEILKIRKEMESLSKQIQNLGKEVDALNKKNKILGTERERLINMVDSKVCDIQSLQKECDRHREDSSAKEFKLKWIQTKLTAETEGHKETQEKLEKCKIELNSVLDEASRMRQDCQDMINSYTPNSLSPQQCSTGLIDLLPHAHQQIVQGEDTAESIPEEVSTSVKTVDSGPSLNPFQKEIEILKGKHEALINENNSLSCRVQSLQEGRLDLEHKMSRLQESNADHLHQIASLQLDLSTAESLRIQLMTEQERVTSLHSECECLRQCNAELLVDMALCRGKESELLAYTQQVTEKNVLLQSEFSSVEAKSLGLNGENERLRCRIKELMKEVSAEEKLVLQERRFAELDRGRLLTELELEKEKTLNLERQLEEANGDSILMKKKYETSLRELMKELKSAMRSTKEVTNGSADGLSQSSRTSSSTSLNILDSNSQPQKNLSDQEWEGPVIPDQQVLVERIVKLQRMLAKKQEKNEFLEEYAKELRETAQRQRKIIQAYAMRQEGGAMSSDISDQNKAEFIRHGGVMGSVYSCKPVDDGLTFELSLEINRKLQAVLEDTLLKNITLKDNLSTLGEENSKLSARLRELEGNVR